uniref:NB-ARC domain-containing protein n=1 Tax=Leersia perrieri TaxID=77586 RepID=A0A0D9XS80_9ORYZ
MSGLFASLAIKKALDTLCSILPASLSASSSSRALTGRQEQEKDLEDLRKLEKTIRRIHATLHDAEQHWEIREVSAKLRLKELKELAYDAEDVVEEYEYEVKLCKAKALEKSSSTTNHKRKRQEENEAFPRDAGTVPVSTEMASQIRMLLQRFDNLVEYHHNFTLSVSDGVRLADTSTVRTNRETSSVVVAQTILGRDEEKDKIIEILIPREGNNVESPVSVFAIVGMGGVGKTTLAQIVYNDSRMQESFDMRAWVCVSEKFDVHALTRSIICSLKKGGVIYQNIVLEKLVDEIRGKKVLLVLDDVWNEGAECWTNLCKPMMTTELCKIIVTTRSERVAKLVQTKPNFHNLNCLSFEQSWLLFKQQVAFTVDQENALSDLVEIGRAIVKKCKGLPLVIKTLASMLRWETSEQRWRDVLESRLWDLENPRNEVLPSLQLSYTHMPIYLKRCFLALSLYPKDYMFDEPDVLQLWKVLDLLHDDGYNIADETGSRYLHELVERSFLQPNFEFMRAGRYVMHDLIHDLACFLSMDEFFRVDGDTSMKIPENARYISIQNASGEISTAPPCLRAIIVLSKGATVNINNPEALFSNSGKLRALVLDKDCLGLEFSALMGKLKLLRHLKSAMLYSWHSGSDFIGGLHGIGHLINLVTLPLIDMGKDRMTELTSLNEIRELSIDGISIMSDVHDVKGANLHSKKHLQFLRLGFVEGYGISTDSHHSQQMKLLDSMRPNHSISHLMIYKYNSPMYPCWLGDASFIKLTTIEFNYCSTQSLPTLGNLPFLASLLLHSMDHVQRIGREFHGVNGFPSLIRLRFIHMPQWSEWSEAGNGDFPRLHTLLIGDATRLSSLPSESFMSLTTLELTLCPIERIPALPKLRILHIDMGYHSNSHVPLLNPLPSLECLKIICVYATCIPLVPQHLPLLRTICLSSKELMNCDGLGGLASLQHLKLWGCSKLPIHSLLPRMQLQTLDIRDKTGTCEREFKNLGSEIGRAIVKKCKGLPLVIKTLASMLRWETSEQRWRDVLENRLWDLKNPRNEVLPSLQLSYTHMPIYLKRCFLALSLYPKDFLLDTPDVLQLWKVLDLLQGDGYHNSDETGSRYLHELVERSFLQANFEFFGEDGRYVMHDLIHDLACFLSMDEFFRLDGDASMEIPQNARAIIVLPKATVNINNPEELFSNCGKLRALVLDKNCLGLEFPTLMSKLKLLRHLKFTRRHTYSFGQLCEPVRNHIGGLHGIGHLINLVTLPPIDMGNDRTAELMSLNEIRELSISRIMLNIHDVKGANIHSKKHLQLLQLDFGNEKDEISTTSHHSKLMKLLDSLRPNHSIRDLIINNYKIPIYPCWLGDSSFIKLTTIVFKDCDTQYLPTLGNLPFLTSLHFCMMWHVGRTGREFHGVNGFPSLTRLTFADMAEWSEWSEVGNGDFPRLHSLSISSANHLKSLPSDSFMSLTTLELTACQSIEGIPALPKLRILHMGWSCNLRVPQLNPLPSLDCLKIIWYYTTCIYLVPQHLPLLRMICLCCEELMYCEGLGGLASLRDLKLWGCSKFPIHSLLPRLQLQTLDVRDGERETLTEYKL